MIYEFVLILTSAFLGVSLWNFPMEFHGELSPSAGQTLQMSVLDIPQRGNVSPRLGVEFEDFIVN